jgi:hypothetical protein
MTRPNFPSSRSLILLFAILLLAGCAHYDFNLVKPEQFAATVGKKDDTPVTVDPLEYRFRNVDNFLVVRIKNPTGDPIQLLGDRSSAVDGRGEAHPLRSQTIPPGAYVKVIVPPPRPTAYDPGPHFGFGLGVIGRAGRGFGGLYDPLFYDEPRVYTLYDEGNNYYWDWRGNTSVKLTFTFERGGKTFSDEFTFFKKKL